VVPQQKIIKSDSWALRVGGLGKRFCFIHHSSSAKSRNHGELQQKRKEAGHIGIGFNGRIPFLTVRTSLQAKIGAPVTFEPEDPAGSKRCSVSCSKALELRRKLPHFTDPINNLKIDTC